MHPDEGFSEITNVEIEYQDIDTLSESDTRCKLIDRILISCLGWVEDDITREPHVDSGFIDYRISIDGVDYLVVEAKKVGDSFDIPITWKNRIYKISGAISTNENLLSAMKQAKNYCLDSGIKYAIVTNGKQFIAFSAFLPGKKWEEGNCIVYSSLSDIRGDFSNFWNIFSKEAVINGSLINHIEKQKSTLQFVKLLHEIYNPEQKWERNRIYTYLADIVEFVFTEMLDDAKTKVLRKCYVFDRSNQSLGDDLDNLLVDKMPYFAENYKIQDIIESKTKAGIFEKTFRRIR